MAVNVNRVVLTGNLTADPELHKGENQTSRCRMRIAVNGRKRRPEGDWVEKPNFLDVTVFGAQAETCATYLGRGRAIAVDGRLDWSSWVDDQGKARQAVQVIAESVQFLGARPAAAPEGEGNTAAEADPPGAAAAPEPAAVAADAEDIPF